MKCEHCGRNEATFYVKSNINGRVTEQNLCAECARKMGYTERLQPLSVFSDDFFMRPFRMFEPLLGDMGTRMLTEFPAPVETVAQERETELVSKEEQEKLKRECRRNALQAQLQTAIETEDFETAAKLRDELRGLSA